MLLLPSQRSPLRTEHSSEQLATEGRQHARVGPHFPCGALPVFILLIPLLVQFCARLYQERSHFVMASAFALPLRGIAPAVERPPQRRSVISFVLRFNRGAVLQQQLDGVYVSAVRGPMQTGLSIMLKLGVHLHTCL